MRLRPIAYAAAMLLFLAAFNPGFAQSDAAGGHAFDWIFFAILGLPLIVALLELFGVFERFVRPWPWEARRAQAEARGTGFVERPDSTRRL